MLNNIDLLIVGAGPVGCVVANKAANELGWKVLMLEKRNHIAGNCYDCYHDNGVLIHRYGPHYFRTNNKALLDYLSKYTSWIPGNYFVKSYTKGEYFAFPISLLTLEQFYNKNLTADQAKKLLKEVSENIPNPSNSEEFVLSRVGKELYEAFYLGYTLKQWDIHPKDLHKSVCGRIPIRFNKDPRYVDHKYQVTPEHGFTKLFANMIGHKNIHILLNSDFRELRKSIQPKKATLYTGAVDEYFGHKFGKLPWRSLVFDFKTYYEEKVQPVVQVNYPNNFDYTRSVEIKHVTKQKHPYTVVSYEYPVSEGDPYYPIPREANHQLNFKYQELAEEERKQNQVYFAGRLAKYTYLNTDQAIESALETYEQIKKDLAHE